MNVRRRTRGAYGVGPFRPTNAYQDRYSSAADILPAGTGNSVRAILARPARRTSTPTTNNLQVMLENSGAVSSGWRMLHYTAVSPTARIYVADGGGVGRFVTLQLSKDPARVLLVMMAFDGANLWCRTSEGQTASTACVGYKAATYGTDIGKRSAGNQALADWSMVAALGSDATARTLAEMESDIAVLADNLQQGRDLRSGLPWAPQAYWDARDVADVQPPRAVWRDRVAGAALTRAGSPQSTFAASRRSL